MSSHFLETLSLSLSSLSPSLSSVPHYPGVYQVKLVDYQMNIKDFLLLPPQFWDFMYVLICLIVCFGGYGCKC